MIKRIVDLANDISHVKIIDTDSLFIEIGSEENLSESIANIEKYINSEMVNFMRLHNMNFNDSINMRLKNEFKVNKMIAYTKKRYIADAVDVKKGTSKVEIRGIEGRRATQLFVIDIVNHLQKYIQQKDDKIDLNMIFYDVFSKIENAFCNFNISYISMPVNPPKSFSKLKSVQSPARGMINFDVFVSEVFSKINAKGMHIPIYISEDFISKNADIADKCKKIIKQYQKFPSIKLKTKKKDTLESFYSRIIKDITIPEMLMNASTMNQILKMGIKIDYMKILKTFFKKFINLYSPVFNNDENFNFEDVCLKTIDRINETYCKI